TFSMTLGFWDEGRTRPLLTYDVRRLLHGEQEFEYLAPVYAGDTLTATGRVADVYEKAGSRGGVMTFGVIETTFTNQRGEAVLISRSGLGGTAGPVKKEGPPAGVGDVPWFGQPPGPGSITPPHPQTDGPAYPQARP